MNAMEQISPHSHAAASAHVIAQLRAGPSESALPALGALLVLALAFYALLYAPLAGLAEWEAQREAAYTHHTSAREQLRRRGSF